MMGYPSVTPRARIGFIIPSSNRVVEPQMQHYAPPGVVAHFARLRMTNRHRKPLPDLLPEILDSVALLMDSRCDVIVFQCTGTSMSGGIFQSRPRSWPIVSNSSEACITVEDDGKGMPVPPKKGFGLSLVEAFAQQIQGRIEFVKVDTGSRIVLCFPVAL